MFVQGQTPPHGHLLRTCCTTPPTDTANGRARNNSATNMPHRNARAQHLDMSRCWDVANFCPSVVKIIVVSSSVGDVRIAGVRSRCPCSGVRHLFFLLASNRVEWKQARAIRRSRIVVVSQSNRSCNHQESEVDCLNVLLYSPKSVVQQQQIMDCPSRFPSLPFLVLNFVADFLFFFHALDSAAGVFTGRANVAKPRIFAPLWLTSQ